MNLQGAEVERALGRTVMPRYHAWFSLGTVGRRRDRRARHLGPGAGGGAPGAHRGWSRWSRRPSPRAGSCRRAPDRRRPGRRPARERRNPLAAWLEPRTLLIGVVVLAAAFTEGTANDWLSVAIIDGYRHAVLGRARSGFAAFVSAMTVGRVLGTAWLDRYGRVPVLWASFGAGRRRGRCWWSSARRSGWPRRSSVRCSGGWAPRSASRWA